MNIFNGYKPTGAKTIVKDNLVIKIITENLDYLQNKFGNYAWRVIPRYITVKGVARCSPDDVYDYKKGEQIAFKRANIKLEKQKQKILNKIEDIIWENFEQARKHLTTVSKSLHDNENALVRLLEDEQEGGD